MKRRIAIFTMLFLLAVGSFVIDQRGNAMNIQVWVSPKGSDSGTGAKTRPFATLEKARDTIRQMKKSSKPIDVIIAGPLQIHQTFKLETSDSGTKTCPITYKGIKGAAISGGVRVSNFEPVSDPDVLSMLDDKAKGNVLKADLKSLGMTDFGPPDGGGMELFFNDKPMTLSRWPNEGFTKIVDVIKNQPYDIRGTWGDRVGDIIYAGDRPSRWVKEKDPWVHGYWFWDWSDQRHKIGSIDTDKKIIKIAPPYHTYGYRPGQYFYAFNMLSEIDMPGEWYVDRDAGILYFWPPSELKNAKVVASVVGIAITASKVSNVRFENLLIEATRGDAINISASDDVVISSCLVRNTGGGAIDVSGGSNCTVQDCEVYGIGRGGISISGGDRITLTPASHQLLRCHIHDYGRIQRMYSAGAAVGGVGNKIASCKIHDAPHQAIGFWGNENVMEYNEIYRVCMESNDAGAIYSGRDWSMLGNKIQYNYFHDINGFEEKGCVGVYLDDFFCGTTVYGNVFKNVTRAAMVGGGRENYIENNLFIDCNPSIHLDARGEGWARSYFDGTDTTLKDRLNAVDYKSKYYARYKWLATAMDEPNPGHPTGNKYNNNVGIGGVWESVEEIARPGNEFKDNTVTTDRSLLTVNAKTGIPDLTKDAYKKTGLKAIPTDKMGLIKTQ